MIYEALPNLPPSHPHPQVLLQQSLLPLTLHHTHWPSFSSSACKAHPRVSGLAGPSIRCSPPAFHMAGLTLFIGSPFKRLFTEKSSLTIFTISKMWPSIIVYSYTLSISLVLPTVTYNYIYLAYLLDCLPQKTASSVGAETTSVSLSIHPSTVFDLDAHIYLINKSLNERGKFIAK